MPELAEVEYYRKQWDPCIGAKIVSVAVHSEKRIFRFADAKKLKAALVGARLLGSEAKGKRMLFRFSKGCWLGIHLGMTGELWIAERATSSPHAQRTAQRAVPTEFVPGKHDHLVLFQKERALVFTDMRQFGAVRFHQGANPPPWWAELPTDVTSREFTSERMNQFLSRHGRLPIKAALLLQSGFPGIGNWMADEILWRARISPQRRSADFSERETKRLWESLRFVCREAMNRISHDYSDPPKGWFFHQRWSREGTCPRDRQTLRRETIGGRTTAWCPKCQT